MSNSLPLNPFMSVRPRAQDTAPSKAPRKTNHSRAPKSGNVHLLLDSNGRQTVSLERREATAMASAASAKREAAKLKDQLGFSARHATILRVEDATGADYDFVPLRRWCKAHEVTPETVPDKRYPKGVKAWTAAAWMDVYGVDIAALFAQEAA